LIRDKLRKSRICQGRETEINSGVEAFPSVFITSRLLFSGAAKNRVSSPPLRICMMEMIETTKQHFQRNTVKWHSKLISYRIC